MESHYGNIIDNLVSSFLYFIIPTLVIFLIIKIPKFKRWYSFLKLLGINRKNSEIKIYVSRLQVKPQGTKGVGNENEQPKNGYFGPAITQNEYEAALLFQKEIQRLRALFFPRRMHEFFIKRKFFFKRIEAPINASPEFKSLEDSKNIYCAIVDSSTSANTILIGSDIYNLLSYETMKQKDSMIRFKRDEERNFHVNIKVNDGSWKWEKKRMKETESDIPRCELGIIQRLQNKNGSKVILCAGTSSGATYATALFLYKKWKEIKNCLKYSDNNFSFYLEFNDFSDNKEKMFEEHALDDLTIDKFKQEQPRRG